MFEAETQSLFGDYRLGRNMQELISVVNDLNEKGISFYRLQENITMDKKISTGGMEIMLKVTGKMLLQDFSGTSYSAFNRRYRHVKELSDLFHGPLA